MLLTALARSIVMLRLAEAAETLPLLNWLLTDSEYSIFPFSMHDFFSMLA